VFYVPNKYTVHAEQDCISKCPKNKLKHSIMILVKISNLEDIYPCMMCTGIITKYGIKRVYSFSIN